ncbi:mannan endo-1,4-beta-mannosidase 5-like [Wolffia australiana]
MASSNRPRKLRAFNNLTCPVFGLAAIAAGFIFLIFRDVGFGEMAEEMSFVGRNGTNFVLDGSPFYVNGWNSYWLMDRAVEEFSLNKVREIFRVGNEIGLTVCRTWAFNDGAYNALQVSLGRFDERVFRALDRVLVEARKYKIRLLLSLANNMEDYGGKIQYVKWAWEEGIGLSSSNDSFFVDPSIRNYFKLYLKTLLTRKNHLTGVEYRDDPIIFGWELMNEPRCSSDASGDTLQRWIEEMSDYVKALDEKHLLTVGVEGFYGPKSSSEKLRTNPPGEWAEQLGADFIRNANISAIDFASVHIYPDNWLAGREVEIEEKIRYAVRWAESHIEDGDRALRKPVFFTEFGVSDRAKGFKHEHRVLFLKAVLDVVFKSALHGGAGAGAAVWQLMAAGLDDINDGFGMNPLAAPPVYELLKEQSCRLASIGRRRAENLSQSSFCGP